MGDCEKCVHEFEPKQMTADEAREAMFKIEQQMPTGSMMPVGEAPAAVINLLGRIGDYKAAIEREKSQERPKPKGTIRINKVYHAYVDHYKNGATKKACITKTAKSAESAIATAVGWCGTFGIEPYIVDTDNT